MEHPVGVLQRFHPDKTTIVNLEESDDQMKVFDGLNKAQVTLIDIRAGLLSKTLRSLSRLVSLTACAMGVSEFRWFTSSASTRPRSTRSNPPRRRLRVPSTMSCSTTPTSRSFIGPPATVKDPISVGLLDETAASTVDMKGMGFNAFYADGAGQSRTLRGYVNAWLKPVFRSYEHRRAERCSSPA
jgi:hypothetical protein